VPGHFDTLWPAKVPNHASGKTLIAAAAWGFLNTSQKWRSYLRKP